MKVLVIGCGKRFKNIYYDILISLGFEIFLWNRTLRKSKEFCEDHTCTLVTDLKDVRNINPSLILCFTPPNTHFDIVNSLKYDLCPILLETPAEESRLLNTGYKLGTLEQWPHLPIEQFKEKIFSSNIMKRPYIAFNDGRSFDYHAIAQLRSYLKQPTPVLAKGTLKIYDNPGVLDKSGVINSKPHEWLLGQVEMSDGSIISYNFSYTCKSLLSIPVQFLRSLSQDGSITSGRMKDIGNDYEILDIRTVNRENHEVEIHDVKYERIDSVTKSIEGCGIKWSNPYWDLSFDDQQTAIASLLNNAINGKLYSYKESFIDFLCINMIKQSALMNQVLKTNI